MGWPWSKQDKPQEIANTAAAPSPDRYSGKPLLRLLELYVLWSLGELSDEDALRLGAMASKLTETFGGNGTWQDALETTMQMPSNMPELVRDMWAKNISIANNNGVELHPEQFAQKFVDSNLA